MKINCALALAVLSSGCLIPRSGVMGMPASRVGVGGAEVGLSTGAIFSTGSTSTTTSGFTSSTNSSAVQVPLVEANARIGLADAADLNLHLGAAGIEPGLKLGATVGSLDLAVMPSFAIGVYNANTSSGSTGSTSSTTSATYLSVIGGLHLMASLANSFYVGLKYWYQYASESSGTGGTAGTNTSENVTGHNLGLNIGWDFSVGPLNIRPEISASMQFGQQASSMNTTQGLDGVTFTIMPNITIAALKKPAAQAAPPPSPEGPPPPPATF